MTARVLIAGLCFGALAGCVPGALVECPSNTEEIGGECLVACAIDDECLIGEVCDTAEHACVRGEGERPVITDLRAAESPVVRGRPVHLFYAAQNAVRVTIDHGTLASSTKTTGDVWTQPIDDTTEFEVVAFGP